MTPVRRRRPRRARLGQGPGDARARPGQTNYARVDKFTVAHYAWGVLLGAARLPWWAALGWAVGWEIVERPLKRSFPQVFPHASQDTFGNAAIDALAVVAGWTSWQVLPRAVDGDD